MRLVQKESSSSQHLRFRGSHHMLLGMNRVKVHCMTSSKPQNSSIVKAVLSSKATTISTSTLIQHPSKSLSKVSNPCWNKFQMKFSQSKKSWMLTKYLSRTFYNRISITLLKCHPLLMRSQMMTSLTIQLIMKTLCTKTNLKTHVPTWLSISMFKTR